jgi:predicted DNA-binding transcriptional regulator YafY
MAVSKFAHGRYLLINRELRKNHWVKTSQLREKIESELSLSITQRQIEKDLEAMKSDSFLKYYAPIDYDKKNKAYCYTDREFNIERFSLKDDEILALKFCAAMLNQYRDSGLFKDFSNALKKVVEAVSIKSLITGSIDSRLIVQTDTNVEVKGIQFLSEIANAIDKRKKILFGYKKFEDDEPTDRRFAPYLLKEHKSRWYIVGRLDGESFIRTFALDRITVLTAIEEGFEPDIDFDAIKYYQSSFGITAPDGKEELIVMLFSPQEGNYIKTLKIHHTQEIISTTKRGLKVSIRVKPCYELFEYILGKGSDLKILSPKKFANHVAKIHSMSARQYQLK